ncbi:peptidase inhibitor i78 family domain-containing protein [Cordyceps javanica]|uniref:Peptidase inhibitor i78 family domain-containing protein n=1 Tax=Cordyceps javanica TaxID=43265 RepID=A0A545UWE4_9HYPO|nr:peptidase inhibitor i78 family domain-containing protein [Cordyceps javanica]TQW04561.1 peptidase inhibitor i78 family domain-containing protein [Cordyceps javanica]
MPLVLPNQNPDASANSKTEEWQNKLVGKTVTETATNETNFCKRDLPQQTRIIEPGTIVTKDFVEDRLNVHVEKDGVVTHVYHG